MQSAGATPRLGAWPHGHQDWTADGADPLRPAQRAPQL